MVLQQVQKMQNNTEGSTIQETIQAFRLSKLPGVLQTALENLKAEGNFL